MRSCCSCSYILKSGEPFHAFMADRLLRLILAIGRSLPGWSRCLLLRVEAIKSILPHHFYLKATTHPLSSPVIMAAPQSPQVLPSPPLDAIDDHETGVGLSDAQLSQSRRQMLDLVNRLQSTGYAFSDTPPVDAYKSFCHRLFSSNSVQVDIDLPQIAVIGSQSAGKSSLIESISGITLPRAAGTCTGYAFYFGPWPRHSTLLPCIQPDAQPNVDSHEAMRRGNAESHCGS
jgi:hypothetical protein